MLFWYVCIIQVLQLAIGCWLFFFEGYFVVIFSVFVLSHKIEHILFFFRKLVMLLDILFSVTLYRSYGYAEIVELSIVSGYQKLNKKPILVISCFVAGELVSSLVICMCVMRVTSGV
eukprot:TRINITY_DN3569_c0_g1_i1.p3 TRINITY_DN3569_c0_g1~~TRINITY_DN3569_c0_g1_i1.p3  ORF type:complete len:117 (-),score=3.04 TRINITY_DN3569_c0_g1_i1:23-373(-)